MIRASPLKKTHHWGDLLAASKAQVIIIMTVSMAVCRHGASYILICRNGKLDKTLGWYPEHRNPQSLPPQ